MSDGLQAAPPRSRRRKLTLSDITSLYVLIGRMLPMGIIALWSVSNGWFPPSILPGIVVFLLGGRDMRDDVMAGGMGKLTR